MAKKKKEISRYFVLPCCGKTIELALPQEKYAKVFCCGGLQDVEEKK